MSKSFLNRTINEAQGNGVGSSTTYRTLYDQIESASSGIRSLWRTTDSHTSGNTFETSFLKELSKRRSDTRTGNVCIFHFPKNIIDNQFNLYWICLNAGSYLTGDSQASGNVMHLACNSLATASWNFAEDPSETNKINFISTIEWTGKLFSYMVDPKAKNYWKETCSTLNLLLEQTSSENILRPISAMVVLGSMGRPIDKWNLLSKIMISVSRTYHDCGATLATGDALGRVFVFMVLLDLLDGTPLETVVQASKMNFVKEFQSMSGSDKSLKIISIMTAKILKNTSEDSVRKVSSILLELMKPHKLSTLCKADITSKMTSSFVVEGDMIVPLNRNAGYWKVSDNSNLRIRTADNIGIGPSDSNWTVVAFPIPVDATSGRLDIDGKFIGGSGGNPGVRIYSGPEVSWRKKGYQGLTSNGGRGDGFGAPVPLDGTCKVNLGLFKNQSYLASVSFNKKGDSYEIMAKFEGWTKFHSIYHVKGDMILIAAKAFSLDVKMVNMEYYQGEVGVVGDGPAIGGTTLSSITSGDSLASELFGLNVGGGKPDNKPSDEKAKKIAQLKAQLESME